jgi:hypothetical protein
MEKHKIILRSKWTKHGFYHECRECEREVIMTKRGPVHKGVRSASQSEPQTS